MTCSVTMFLLILFFQIFIVKIEGLEPRALKVITCKDQSANQWMVSIQRDNKHTCNGILLDENAILTTALCCIEKLNCSSKGPNPHLQVVRTHHGEDLTGFPKGEHCTIITVDYCIIHPEYVRKLNYIENDAAIVVLVDKLKPFEEPPLFEEYHYNKDFYKVCSKGMVIGWWYHYKKNPPDSMLECFPVTIKSLANCAEASTFVYLRKSNNFTLTCSYDASNRYEVCGAFYGAALMCNEKVVGLVSHKFNFSEQCVQANRRTTPADENIVCIRSVQNTSTRTEKILDRPIHSDKSKNFSFVNDVLEESGTSLGENVGQEDNEIIGLNPVNYNYMESDGPKYRENSGTKVPIRIRRKKDEVEHRYFCETCDKGFTRKFDMLRHKKQKHDEDEADTDCVYRNKNKEIINKCKSNESFKDGRTMYEVQQGSNEIIHLIPEKQEYTESDGLKYKETSSANGPIRIRRKKNEVEERYFCEICDKGFTRKFDMLRHKKQKHDEADMNCEYRNKNKGILNKCKTNESFEDGKTMYEVEQGSEEIIHIIPVKHEVSESEDLCSPEYEENSESKRPIRIRRKKSEVENRYFCETCDKGFTRRFDMLRHKKQKHDETTLDSEYRNKNKEIINKCRIYVDGRTMYECDFCKRKSTYSYNLMRHRSIHTGVKPHVCYICGKSFRLDSSFRQHINHFHKGVKNYRCEICNKNFSTKLARDEHLNIHSDKRPYSCDICQKSFRQKSSLYIHKLYHDKNFRFECSLCEKKFRRAQELLIHERIHTGHRPYACNVCSAKFMQNKDLKRHKRIHTKNKLEWICSICESSFEQERYLKLHMRVHKMQES